MKTLTIAALMLLTVNAYADFYQYHKYQPDTSAREDLESYREEVRENARENRLRFEREEQTHRIEDAIREHNELHQEEGFIEHYPAPYFYNE